MTTDSIHKCLDIITVLCRKKLQSLIIFIFSHLYLKSLPVNGNSFFAFCSEQPT